MAISGPNRLAIVVWAPTSEKACHGLDSGPWKSDFLCWSSLSVASIFCLCCYEKKTNQTHEWVQKGKLQVLVVLKSTGNFTRDKSYPRLIEEKIKYNWLTQLSTFSFIGSLLNNTSRTGKGRKWESTFFEQNVSTNLSKSIVFHSTSEALYAGVVYFLILSSSMPISSGFSKCLWLVEVLPKNFHNPLWPNRRFSAFI